MNKEKNQKLAAFLNFILPGVGYIYNGNRVTFITIMLVAFIVSIIAGSDSESVRNLDVLTGIIFSIGFGYDAYIEAEEINVNLNKI